MSADTHTNLLVGLEELASGNGHDIRIESFEPLGPQEKTTLRCAGCDLRFRVYQTEIGSWWMTQVDAPGADGLLVLGTRCTG